MLEIEIKYNDICEKHIAEQLEESKGDFMKLFSLEELAESKDKEVAKQAKEAMKLGFPDTARFEIVIKQVII